MGVVVAETPLVLSSPSTSLSTVEVEEEAAGAAAAAAAGVVELVPVEGILRVMPTELQTPWAKLNVAGRSW